MKSTELADSLGSSCGFVSQAMTPLVSKGWVRSDPGPTGGYSVSGSLDHVSVLDVIEAVEGPTDTERCVLEDASCATVGSCALHQPWSRARRQMLDELGRTPMSTLARPESEDRYA